MKNCGNETEWRMIPAVVQGFLVAFGSTRWSGSAGRHAPFAPLEKWKKLFSNLQKQLFRVWTTRCHMLNNQTLRPASCLEWNPWLWMQFLQLHKKPEKNSGLQWGLGLQTLLKSWIYFRLLMQLHKLRSQKRGSFFIWQQLLLPIHCSLHNLLSHISPNFKLHFLTYR